MTVIILRHVILILQPCQDLEHITYCFLVPGVLGPGTRISRLNRAGRADSARDSLRHCHRAARAAAAEQLDQLFKALGSLTGMNTRQIGLVTAPQTGKIPDRPDGLRWSRARGCGESEMYANITSSIIVLLAIQ